ncbi:hypothetical protein [Pyxidicoccus parkwayensis]|nr:hypothetical protein [Pyxidicoccus parkwaysis]
MARSLLVPRESLCVVVLAVSLLGACSDDPEPTPQPAPPSCKETRSNERIPVLPAAARQAYQETFTNLAARVNSECGSCHQSPNNLGGLSYTATRDDLKDKGPRMLVRIQRGEMPPVASADQLKKAVELGVQLSAWLEQGSPEGSFTVNGSQGATVEDPIASGVASAMTDLGNCTPAEDKLGSDPDKDAYFEGLTQLPRFLSETDTDVTTFDAEKLARHGTFAFAPTYPLFSDHAKKLRLVHVPQGKSIAYDAATKKFKVPPNTRFYKTFFKDVTGTDGVVRYRKIETRLIVTRERWQDAVFGTYVWNEEGTVAELHRETYRDGSTFADRVLTYKKDERTGATRNYAIPARHRCVNCHTGSEGQNFVLGFTPLQLNRRAPGEGGVDPAATILEDELSQVDRLIKYGVITGLGSAADLPKLETSAEGRAPSSKEELELQGYFIGNCAQCHNPRGFAVQSNQALAFMDFSAGGILFGWKPFNVLETNGRRRYVAEVEDFGVDLGRPYPTSTLYERVARDTNERNIHMPLNVPGKDCRASLLVARWIATLDWPKADEGLTAEEKAAAKKKRMRLANGAVVNDCNTDADVRWVGEDFTDKLPYQPRNPGWKEHVGKGAWEYLTRYPITEAHEQLAKKRFPTNWWDLKPGLCTFPTASAPSPVEAWMTDRRGVPKRPWGELYYSTAGANVFQGICANCHGRAGDGQSGAAKALVAWQGARVANLTSAQYGLFGRAASGASHLAPFEQEYGPHGAARYLVWMADGGTNVPLTEEFMQAWVKYGEVDIDFSNDTKDWEAWGANMLGAASGACDLIRRGVFATAVPPSGNIRAIGGTSLWTEICTLDNPLTDEIRSGSDATAVAEWLKRAQFNAGVMAYFYLRDELSQGRVAPLRSECDRR